ncbi:alpha/beta hydrolase [Sinimarinibacterium sp. CAU 1509]|uniref:alpha/beta fold hydrolase n=1 Tax=Sinimarinibacterium sp. CAU 1509 TaxID=2562283 RepID=UPI0010AD2748|nr:alpha/beta hydrolase [Sinimarinibacterium sp. CAU 1509]TJY59032.1 alpha/beta hydrolase [Sinimarinibacterium sp. CAU 1509]
MAGTDVEVLAALGVPEQSQQFIVDVVPLAVAREGKGQPVVCLHAIGHGGGDFAGLSAALRADFEVIRVDWPGHGRSGSDSHAPDAQRYAELLGRLLDQLGIVSPIVIGNSIGGAAAIILASRRPVRALVLCDAGGLVAVSPLVRGFCAVFQRFFAAGERGARWFARAYAFYYRWIVLPAPAAAARRAQIIAAGYACAPLLRRAWASFARPQADLRDLAAALDVPVWCAWARSDRVIPLLLCRPAIRRMKHATLSRFSGGHSAFLEQPEAFLREFRAFAASCQPANGSDQVLPGGNGAEPTLAATSGFSRSMR